MGNNWILIVVYAVSVGRKTEITGGSGEIQVQELVVNGCTKTNIGQADGRRQ